MYAGVVGTRPGTVGVLMIWKVQCMDPFARRCVCGTGPVPAVPVPAPVPVPVPVPVVGRTRWLVLLGPVLGPYGGCVLMIYLGTIDGCGIPLWLKGTCPHTRLGSPKSS